MNLSDLISDGAVRHGDRDFLLFERQPPADAEQGGFRQRLTYRELDAMVKPAIISPRRGCDPGIYSTCTCLTARRLSCCGSPARDSAP
jgi:hypothetical protein